MKITDDIEIIKHILGGNDNAYRIIIGKYKNSCYNLAYRILACREDAEECISDAFINAYNSLDKYRHDMKFRAWIMRITYNRAISMKRRKKVNTLPIIEEYEYPNFHTGEEIYSDIFAGDKEQMINYALSFLDEESRAIVNLFYYEDASLEEISLVVNSNVNTVKSKLFRARQKMKSAINRFIANEEKNTVMQ